MSPSRRQRRHLERARVRRRHESRHLSLPSRIALVVFGLVAIVAGGLLLVAGTPSTSARLGRVAGILILAGIIASVFGIIGRL